MQSTKSAQLRQCFTLFRLQVRHSIAKILLMQSLPFVLMSAKRHSQVWPMSPLLSAERHSIFRKAFTACSQIWHIKRKSRAKPSLHLMLREIWIGQTFLKRARNILQTTRLKLQQMPLQQLSQWWPAARQAIQKRLCFQTTASTAFHTKLTMLFKMSSAMLSTPMLIVCSPLSLFSTVSDSVCVCTFRWLQACLRPFSHSSMQKCAQTLSKNTKSALFSACPISLKRFTRQAISNVTSAKWNLSVRAAMLFLIRSRKKWIDSLRNTAQKFTLFPATDLRNV